MRVDPAVQEQVLTRFMEATRTGNIGALLEVLAPDVVLVADGGGVAAAVRRPVEGAQRVAAVLSGLGRVGGGFSATALQVNGAPALVIDVPGDVPTVITATVADGRITRIYAMRNPHKLGRIAKETALSR
jgi:RNA polymerase sigma-70 factor (ECF subfamily)